MFCVSEKYCLKCKSNLLIKQPWHSYKMKCSNVSDLQQNVSLILWTNWKLMEYKDKYYKKNHVFLQTKNDIFSIYIVSLIFFNCIPTSSPSSNIFRHTVSSPCLSSDGHKMSTSSWRSIRLFEDCLADVAGVFWPRKRMAVCHWKG